MSIPIYMAATFDSEKLNHTVNNHGDAFFQILGRWDGDWVLTQIVVAFITNDGQTNWVLLTKRMLTTPSASEELSFVFIKNHGAVGTLAVIAFESTMQCI